MVKRVLVNLILAAACLFVWLPLLLICVLTTIITFAATACSVRFTMYLLSRR